MKWIRCFSLLFVFLMLFASTTFGEVGTRSITIENKSVYTAYVAYVYAVDAEVSAFGESIGYHVKGWVSVLSGHRKSIPYRSNYKPFVYFILENNVEFFKDAKNRESEHGVPANLWRAISNGRKPLVETFEIIQSLEDGKIVSSTGVDRSDLKDVIFYRGRDVTIRGPVDIIDPSVIDNPSVKDPFDGVYDTRGFKRSGTGTDYALLFATDKYELLPEDKEKKLSPWRNLEKPIKDAKALGTELEKYGFKVDIRENVKTRSDIRDILNEYDKKYEPGDQLLVYFAGHGYCSAEQKKIGYIAASASRRPENDLALNTYVSYSYIRDFLDGLSCARIMLVLDVCYGGTFDRDIGFDKDIDFDRDIALNMEENPTSRGNGTRGLQQRLDLKETLKAKTRWYLSSGGKEEVQDGFGLEHSPFAASLLALLRDEASKDKVLTIPEIERQLPSKLRTELVKIEKAWKEEHPLWEGKLTQTPASGPFGSSKKSDKAFVFIKQ